MMCLFMLRVTAAGEGTRSVGHSCTPEGVLGAENTNQD